MRKVILVVLLATLNLLFLQSIHAEIKLPAIVSSKMVLQRNTTINLWGWADVNEKITINASWLKQIITNAETGLYSSTELKDFEIAGADKVFYPADAKIIDRMNVFVKSEKVPNPVAVRYAWRNDVVGTLYDINSLPASSFRTDKWDDASRAKLTE